MQDDYQEVKIAFIAGIIILLIFIAIVVFILLFYQKKRFQHREQLTNVQNEFQQELLKTQLETQEETFRQIGEEIHDNVGQLLSSTKILLAITERTLPEVPETLQTASTTLAKAIQDLRSLSKALNKEWLEKFNLIENLRQETDRINASRTIAVRLCCNASDLSLKPAAQLMLFRIIQEALQNCIKHAAATRIDIHVIPGNHQMDIKIIDDGKGLPQQKEHQAGMGFITMQHRTSLLGGTIGWGPLQDGGTEVFIVIPFQNNSI